MGRRRPFIIYGTIATILFMLILPWSGDAAASILDLLGGDCNEETLLVLRGVIAAACIWGLNVSIQPVQAGVRSLIVDCCPPKQQVQASAYASRITGIGSILGYCSGFISLPDVAPWLGDTQFKGLSVIASIALTTAVVISCSTVEEERLFEDYASRKRSSFFAVFKHIGNSINLMPRRIIRVCIVQFFSWMQWFPFLFYITT